MKRVLIVGGVAGGASAAARLRRLDETAEIVIFERGAHVSFANCGLPYYVGGVISERDRLLVQTPASLRARLNLDVRINTEVTDIDRAVQKVTIRAEDGHTSVEPYDYLILSPGAAPFRPLIPGGDDPRILTLRTISDGEEIKKSLAAGPARRVVVVGGGFIGLEMASNLINAGVQVELVERLPQVLPAMLDPDMAALVHQHLREKGLELHLDRQVERFDAQADLQVVLSDGTVLPADLVIMCAGVRPEVDLARQAGLKLGPAGGIAVDKHLRTSDPAIYAIGDAVEVTELVSGAQALVPLAGPANKQGRIVADHICGRPAAYQGTQGTAILEVLGLTAAGTGTTEAALKKAGIAYRVSLTHSPSHANYYPGSALMAIKLLFTPAGKLLGAQVVGGEGVDKRIDVLATALRLGAGIPQLQELELAYAPPFSSAKDPVNIAGYVAGNLLAGDVCTVQAADVPAWLDKAIFLDVREEADHLAGAIPGSLHIPLRLLRQRLSELPQGQKIVVFCRIGLQAYYACRILQQSGWTDVMNLAGGWRTYSAVEKDKAARQGAAGAADSAGRAVPALARSETAATSEAAACCSADPAACHTLDATGLACPGPIFRVHEAMAALPAGAILEVQATDPGFARDIEAWCTSTGHTLLAVAEETGRYKVRLRKSGGTSAAAPDAAPMQELPHDKTIVVFSGDLDKVLAAFVIATGAAAMGRKVTLFFTFWGLNALRRLERVKVRKGFLDRMFGLMMPRGSRHLGLSRLNMGGAGPILIRRVMQAKGIASLEELMAQARQAGVRVVACQMSMDVMGIKREELLPEVEVAGVASYLAASETADTTLFI